MAVETNVVRDVVVVVPGIMGSKLVDASGQPVWSVSAGALAHAIRTLGKSLRRLQLPAGVGDGSPGDGIRATALLGSLHVVPGLWSPITGYDGLMSFLRSPRFRLIEASLTNHGVIPNLIPFPYDWRLSNRFNGRLLASVAGKALERWRNQPGMGEAKLVLICHSMGGLVARWFAEQEGGAELIRALITVGTPFRGSLKALINLANGLEPGIGPLRIPLTEFARSLPALYQLLPQYDCMITDAGRTGLAEQHCPGLDTTLLADAVAFHKAIAGSDTSLYALHKVVGIRQPTPTTARIDGAKVVPSVEIDGRNQGGDGTVPRLSAEPVAGRGREVHAIADQHGELQGTRSLLDLVDGILSREEIIWQAAEPDEGFGVEMADVLFANQECELQVSGQNDRRLLVTIMGEEGNLVTGPFPVSSDGRAYFGQLPEGGYRAVVASSIPDGTLPVTKPFLVLDPGGEN
jgi:pimeloyl-ACP methyl ester carboxylesterase